MGGQIIHRSCKYTFASKSLHSIYAVFATVHKIDPSQTVGMTALNFFNFFEKF